MHNLEQLDLSNNDLRDLAKLLPVLERFQFLTHLNLKASLSDSKCKSTYSTFFAVIFCAGESVLRRA